MTDSAYMPNLEVEIAFNAGFTAPPEDRVWTDVSDFVELSEGVTITVGRQNERSVAEANTLTLTLDNSDGRFTAFNPLSPYYPNVLLDRPIRVTHAGSDVRFLGFVSEWPVAWEGTDNYAKATITAVSRLARLGRTAKLRSIVESVILADSPVAYYTLGEPEGATQAHDSSGNRAEPLTLAGDPALPVVFGSATGPGTDSLTAAEFPSGHTHQFLTQSDVAITGDFTLEAFFNCSTVAAWSQFIAGIRFATIGWGLVIIGGVGNLSTGRFASSVATVTDGATHHGAITFTGGTERLYLDGVLVDSAAALGDSANVLVVGDRGFGNNSYAGVVAHVALYPSALSDAQIMAHADAGLNGFAGETTSERLERYATLAGIPVAEVSAQPGQTTMQHIDTTGQQIIDLMRIVETTEGGMLFDNRDGVLTFHNRTHRTTQTVAATFDMERHTVEAGYAPMLDRWGLANDVTGKDVTGRYLAQVTDADSIANHGYAPLTIETASEDTNEPLFLASWAAHKYAQPKPRVPSLTVDALPLVDGLPDLPDVLALNVGDLITVDNRPSQDSSIVESFFIEGYTETYGPELLRFTFNLSPAAPEAETLIVGDPVRGAIGVNPIAL